MTPFFRKFFCLMCCLLAAMSLAGCGGSREETTPPTLEAIVLPNAPAATEPRETDPKERIEELAAVMEAGELYTLDSYPSLKSVDLTGSDCYEAMVDFASKRPHLKVSFTVDLGGTQIPWESTSAAAQSYTYEALLENLQYLPNLTSLTLSDISLTAQQVAALGEAYPGVTLDYTVELLGAAYGQDTTELDLSHLDYGSLSQIGPRLGLLTNLEKVFLSGSLTFDEVDALQTAAPGIVFDYPFTFLGRSVNTADTELVYKNESFGNSREEEIRSALKILDNCQRLVLDNCGLDSEVLASIRADFRDGPKVVWRVYFGVDGRYNLLTDEDTLRAVYNVTDSTCGPMKYCEDVRYMDIGHNEYLTDLSFLSYMPNIEVVIASGCAVTELPDLSACQNLTWLELASCGKLTNVDGIAACKSLRFLNLSFTKVSSYEALDNLPLERFVCLSPKAKASEQETFLKIHPKGQCITVFYGYSNPYGYGWRYDDNGKTFNEYYKNVVREAFNYDLLESWLPKDD